MYYEERMLGGKFVCRTLPNVDWEECSIEKAWDRITELQHKLRHMESYVQRASNTLDEALA